MLNIHMRDLTRIIKREFLLRLCPCGIHTQAVGATVPVPAHTNSGDLPRDQRRRFRHQPPILIPSVGSHCIIIDDLIQISMTIVAKNCVHALAVGLLDHPTYHVVPRGGDPTRSIHHPRPPLSHILLKPGDQTIVIPLLNNSPIQIKVKLPPAPISIHQANYFHLGVIH